MNETAYKRKRVTEEIIVYPLPRNVASFEDTHKDALLKIQLKLERVEAINQRLSKEIEVSNTTHSLNIEENTHRETKLIGERNAYKAQAAFHQKHATTASKTLETIKKEHIQVTTDLRKNLEDLRSKAQRLEGVLNKKERDSKEIEATHRSQISALTAQNETYKEQVASLEKTTEHQNDQIQAATAREMALTERLIDLESKLGEAAVSQGTKTNGKLQQSILQDYTHVHKQLTELQKKDAQLSRELEHFKTVYENAEQLRAENNLLQQQGSNIEEIEKAKLILEIENANLQAERDAWVRYLNSESEYKHQTPSDIIFNLSNRADEGDFKGDMSKQLISELKRRDQLICMLEDHVCDLKSSLHETIREKTISDEKLSLSKKTESMLKELISSLEGSLHLYDKEEEIKMPMTYDQKKTIRIAELEKSVRELESKLSTQAQEAIDTSNSDFRPMPNGPYEELTSGVKIIDFLNEMYQEKESFLRDLKETKAEVKKRFNEKISRPQTEQEQLQTNQQDDISANARVLSLADNPASESFAIRRDLLERLQRENKELIDMKLEKAADFEIVSLPKSSIANFEKEKNRLQQGCESLQKRIDRLNTAWTEKVQEILEKVQDCLGYKLTFRNEGMIKIESVFVDGSDLTFLVKEVNGPDEALLRVIGTKRKEYLDQFHEIYQSYIIEKRNIPAFLNAIALELYVDSTVNVNGEHPSFTTNNVSNDEDNSEDMEIEVEGNQRVFEINEATDSNEEEGDDEVEVEYEGSIDGHEYEYGDGESAFDECEEEEAESVYDEYEEAEDDEEESTEPAGPVEITLLDSDSD